MQPVHELNADGIERTKFANILQNKNNRKTDFNVLLNKQNTRFKLGQKDM